MLEDLSLYVEKYDYLSEMRLRSQLTQKEAVHAPMLHQTADMIDSLSQCYLPHSSVDYIVGNLTQSLYCAGILDSLVSKPVAHRPAK